MKFSVHSSKSRNWNALSWFMPVQQILCQCWNNIERKQRTAVWRSWHKLGCWWSVVTELEDCHLIHCELWKYQDTNKLHCWLESRNIYVGRIKIYDITGDGSFPADRTHAMKACKGLDDTCEEGLQRSAAMDAEMRIWQAMHFEMEIKLSVLSLEIAEQQ